MSAPLVDPWSVDLTSPHLAAPALHARGDPHGRWYAMRVRAPVHWTDVSPGLGFWSLTRFADVSYVLHKPDWFTSERGTMLNLLGKEDPAAGLQMAATDPPRHTVMREPLRRAFASKPVERHAESLRQAIRMLLRPALDGGPFDFGQAMITLPMAAAGLVMGLPRQDWQHLTLLTTRCIAADDSEYSLPEGTQRTLEAAHRELFSYFHDVVRERKDSSGDDLISLLLAMEIDGRKLGAAEVLANCYSLLLGANVTTPYVPTEALATLLAEDRVEDLLDNPDVVTSAIEECLRWSSPASHLLRHATRDVEIGETIIRAGDPVAVWLGSADRDEAQFSAPFSLDLHRRPNRHLAFGTGPHYCVGHTVARMGLRILLEELQANFSAFEQVGEPQRLFSNFVFGLKHLTVLARARRRMARAPASRSRSRPAVAG